MQPGDTEQQAAPQTRPCDACGATMERGQDWCLECGTAAPGRLGTRPGMRAAATVVSLTLALVGGAVAASYAALDSDSQQAANQPAPPSGDPVAQAPPGPIQSPAPSDALPPQTDPGTTTVPPGTTTTPTVPTLPNIPQITTPPSTTPPSSNPPTVTIPKIPTTTTPSDDDDDEDTSNGGDAEDEGDGDTPTTTTPSKQTPQPIDIAADAAAHYDPSKRATAKGDPADAVDDDAKSAWYVTTAGAGKDMATGLVIDLGSARGVRVLELATSTPGFRAEIYASDSAELPPDILDTRWAHITDRSKVDQTEGKDKNVKGDGRERIVLGGGSAKYRHVLIWLTTPPSSGTTVRISDVDLHG